MLDVLQILFWSITYVMIIIAGFQSRREKKVSMPYAAGVLNFAWEICALCESSGFWGHIVWVVLDIVIVYFGFQYANSKKHRVVYAASIIICFIVLMHIFKHPNGMLYSVFIIDIIMAICFLTDHKKLSQKVKVPIAITKLIGDTCAGLYYAPQSVFVGLLACIVFLCNMYYLCLCLEEKNITRKRTANKR